jgi:hypothetical protein
MENSIPGNPFQKIDSHSISPIREYPIEVIDENGELFITSIAQVLCIIIMERALKGDIRMTKLLLGSCRK